MPDFRNVDLSEHDITSEKMVQLAGAMRGNPHMTGLELFGVSKPSEQAWKELVRKATTIFGHLHEAHRVCRQPRCLRSSPPSNWLGVSLENLVLNL